MCDYSILASKKRDARNGDILRTHDFGAGTGFTDPMEFGVAVCLKPGTQVDFEIAVEVPLKIDSLGRGIRSIFGWRRLTKMYASGTFKKINEDRENTHHDAIEFPDGHVCLLNDLPPAHRAKITLPLSEEAVATTVHVEPREFFTHVEEVDAPEFAE